MIHLEHVYSIIRRVGTSEFSAALVGAALFDDGFTDAERSDSLACLATGFTQSQSTCAGSGRTGGRWTDPDFLDAEAALFADVMGPAPN